MRKFFAALVIVVVTALVAGGAVYYFSRPGETDARVTVSSIRRIAELATVEYRVSTTLDRKYFSDVGWKFLKKEVQTDRLIAIYTGTVKGRVNLDNATVTIESKPDGDYASIHFKRGSIQVNEVAMDPEKDSFRTVSCQNTRMVFTKGASDNQREALQRDAYRGMLQAALETGIVEKTKENAQTVLSAFVEAFGFRAVVAFDDDAYVPSV